MPSLASVPAPASSRADSEPASSWVVHGAIAGLLGALVIAVFFLILDLDDRRPLWTPHALGAWLFRGRVPAPGAPIEPALVLGYTAIHGVVFLGFGLAAAFEALSGIRRLRHEFTAGLLAAGILFASFELVFVLLGALFTPIVSLLGGGRIAAANLLAAVAMAGYLARARSRVVARTT